MTITLILDDIDPKMLISANRRIHHHVRAEVARYWRGLARDAAIAAYGHAEEGCSWHRRVHLTITVRYPDRRRRDVANLYPFVFKPCVDGLVDARVIPDDDDLRLVGPDPRRDRLRGPWRVAIQIIEEG